MHSKWRVGTFPDEVWIVPSAGAAMPAGAAVISPENAGFRVDEWFPEGGLARELLSDIHEEIGGAFVARPEISIHGLRATLREALRSGVLRAFRVPVTFASSAAHKAPEKPSDPEPPPAEKKTWIAIELVDDADPPNPVPYKKYRVELPDGSIREGMLDDKGYAKIAGIDPGTCKVSFPQIHGEDWDAA